MTQLYLKYFKKLVTLTVFNKENLQETVENNTAHIDFLIKLISL